MSLTDLALKYGSDKAGHSYTPIYEKYFAALRDEEIVLLELGIGGYEYPDRGGASLKMWKDYFSKAWILGVDLYKKTGLEEQRITTFVGSQDDRTFLSNLLRVFDPVQIVIDDASHINPLTIKSFKILFPLLSPGGIYVVEDIESSWTAPDSWAQGMDLYYDYNAVSTVNFFRQLVDEVNQQYIPHYEARGFSDIESIHFHKNIIFILKK